MKKSVRAVVSVLMAVLCLSAWSRPKALELSVHPTYQGYMALNSIVPLSVEARNSGPDARGVVRVECSGYRMDYPIELPKNSDKSLTVYMDVRDAWSGDCSVTLDTTEGSERTKFDPSLLIAQAQYGVLEIGGAPGEMGFLETGNRPHYSAMWTAAYVSPEDAPDRPVAYQGFRMVVLGAGSERLSDGAVNALKAYAMAEGVLVVPGGVASPLFSDRRWIDLMPVKVGQPHMVASSAFLTKIASPNKGDQIDTKLSGAFSAMEFQPLPGTKTLGDPTQKLIAIHRYGLGQVVFLAFSPFEGAMRNWEGRPALFLKIMAQDSRSGMPLQTLLPSQNSAYNPGSPYGAIQDSPFQLSLPDAGKIGWILVAYVVCVVPLNFALLNKYKKREWAWVSAPLVSVIFAGLLMTQASALYGIQTSMANDAVIIAQQGAPVAVAGGHAQIFFSHSGSYDLHLEGVDWVRNGSDRAWERTTHDLSELAPIDTGSVVMPHANPSNLSFNEFDYNQLVPSGFMDVKVSNDGFEIATKTKLTEIYVVTAEGVYSVTDLSAGSSETVKRSSAHEDVKKYENQPLDNQGQAYSPSGISLAASLSRGSVVVVARAPDLEVGPKIGNRVSGATKVLYVAKDSK